MARELFAICSMALCVETHAAILPHPGVTAQNVQVICIDKGPRNEHEVQYVLVPDLPLQQRSLHLLSSIVFEANKSALQYRLL